MCYVPYMYQFYSTQCNFCDMRHYELESRTGSLQSRVFMSEIKTSHTDSHVHSCIGSATFLIKCSQTEWRFVFQAGEILIAATFLLNAFKYTGYTVTYTSMQSLTVCNYTERFKTWTSASFLELTGSFPCQQEPTVWLHPEANKSNTHSHLSDAFKYNSPIND
jgi:hypothetical protein